MMIATTHKFTEDQVERARAVDITEVWTREIGIPLVKEGTRFKAEINPFRNETNPSLYVGGYQRNFVIDYGDNNKGYSAIDLVMHARGCGFPEAVRILLAEYLGDYIADLEPERKNGVRKPKVHRQPATRPITESNGSRGSSIPVDARVTDYTYVDLAGQPRFLVRRFDYTKDGQRQKTFRQFTCLPGSNIKPGIQGVELLPYHIDEVAASIRQGQPVVLCEGEKDADLVRSCWLTATCNPMGAGKWRESYNKYFQGADVVILPDGDQVGLKHALQVYENLQPIARGIRIKILPEGIHDAGDLVENLRAEGVVEKAAKERILGLPDWNLDDLRLAAGMKPELPEEACPEGEDRSQAEFTVRDLLGMKFSKDRFLIENLLPAVGLTILSGKAKAGKSWLALSLAKAIATGDSFLDFFQVEQSGKVLFLALEDNARSIQPRLHELGFQPEMNITFLFDSPQGEPGLKTLCDQIQKHNPSLVVVDLLQALTGIKSGKGVNPYEAEYHVIKQLKDLAARFEVSLVAVHHLRKGEINESNPFESVSGTMGIQGGCDSLWLLARNPMEADGSLHVTGRQIINKSFAVKFENCLWQCLGDRNSVFETETRKLIWQVLHGQMKPLSTKELIEAVIDEHPGKNRNTLRSTLDRMRKSGQVVKVEGGFRLP